MSTVTIDQFIENFLSAVDFQDPVEVTAETELRSLPEWDSLAALGVKQGDTVTVWLPNGLEMVRVWFAINWLGAVYVPINTAYKGNLLAHVLANAGSKVIVAGVKRCRPSDAISAAA